MNISGSRRSYLCSTMRNVFEVSRKNLKTGKGSWPKEKSLKSLTMFFHLANGTSRVSA